MSVLLNRNFSNHFNLGAIKGQRFPLRCAPSKHSVFGFVTKSLCFTISFSTCVYVAGSGEPKAPSLPCTMLLLWMLPASAPRLVPCVAVPAAGRHLSAWRCSAPWLKSPLQSVDAVCGCSCPPVAYRLPNQMRYNTVEVLHACLTEFPSLLLVFFPHLLLHSGIFELETWEVYKICINSHRILAIFDFVFFK